jgi:predicted DNA-binding transcriptional regulator AlpA
MEKEFEIPKLISVKELALIMGLHEKVVYRHISKGVFNECIVKIGDSRTLRFNSTKVKKNIDLGAFGKQKDSLA